MIKRNDRRDYTVAELWLVRAGHHVWRLYKKENPGNVSTMHEYGPILEELGTVKSISGSDLLKPVKKNLNGMVSFGKVTELAGESKITKIVRTTGTLGSDVIDTTMHGSNASTTIPTSPAKSTGQSENKGSITPALSQGSRRHIEIIALEQALQTIWGAKRELRAEQATQRAVSAAKFLERLESKHND